MEVIVSKNRTELERLEGIIARNLQSFYEVGRALMEIRDKGLYRDVLGYQTFEEYCRVKWDFTRMYAHYLIESSKVIENVNHGLQSSVLPANERQTRPLARLEPEKQKEAWQKAVETAPEGKVTAAHVYKIVKDMNEPHKEPVKSKLNQPVIHQEPISKSFQEAFDRMVIEIKNARAMHWKDTSHKGAIELMNVLLQITER